MTKRKIIIDASPGQDDAIALLMALASPEDVDILGITLVSGRLPMDNTIHNALRTRHIANRPDVPIFAGCTQPLRRPPEPLQLPDTDTGLDGYDGPVSGTVEEEHAVDFILRMLADAPPGGITLCTIAPLTNIATALTRAPELADRIDRIVMLAGSHYELGNLTPVAEANVWLDPDAAQAVLRSGIACVVIPLDTTHKVIACPERLEALRRLGTLPGDATAAWADVLVRLYAETFGNLGVPLHGACVIGFLLRPFLFTGRHVNIEVETESDLTRGVTVVDWWGLTPRPPNALFMSDVDPVAMFDLLKERVGRL